MLRATCSRQQPKTKVAAEQFDTASSSIFALLDHKIPPLDSIVAELCGLQEAGSLQQECSNFLICAFAKPVTAFKKTEEKVADLTDKVADLTDNVADTEFLATYRDLVRKWLRLRASIIGLN